jgi:hypothetical protein
VVSCAGIEPVIVLGPLGYRETLVANVPSEGNDFGNHQEQGECPKFPDLTADVTITIDPGNPTQIQDAINALPMGQTLLILPHLGTKTRYRDRQAGQRRRSVTLAPRMWRCLSPIGPAPPTRHHGRSRDQQHGGGYKLSTW